MSVLAGAGGAEFVDECFQRGVDLAELHHRRLTALEATEREQHQQGFVGGAFVALLPDADAVEGLEYLLASH